MLILLYAKRKTFFLKHTTKHMISALQLFILQTIAKKLKGSKRRIFKTFSFFLLYKYKNVVQKLKRNKKFAIHAIL
jgi:hypothetical protein